MYNVGLMGIKSVLRNCGEKGKRSGGPRRRRVNCGAGRGASGNLASGTKGVCRNRRLSLGRALMHRGRARLESPGVLVAMELCQVQQVNLHDQQGPGCEQAKDAMIEATTHGGLLKHRFIGRST